MKKSKRRKGFTLIELMIGSVILVVAMVGIIAVFASCSTINETARNLTFAINGAQEKLEELRNANFATMIGNYSPGGSEGNTFTINPVNWISAGDQSAVIYIFDPNDTNLPPAILNTGPWADPDLDLYEVRIAVCWRQKRGRIFGEDNNLDGDIDAGEDANGNGWLESPARLVTLIARR